MTLSVSADPKPFWSSPGEVARGELVSLSRHEQTVTFRNGATIAPATLRIDPHRMERVSAHSRYCARSDGAAWGPSILPAALTSYFQQKVAI